jgi:hypothetical protein
MVVPGLDVVDEEAEFDPAGVGPGQPLAGAEEFERLAIGGL